VEQLNVYEAKTQLSELLRRVADGEEFTIARAGHPVARLVPVATPRGPRVPGALRGRIKIADDFDDTPPDVIAAFEGQEAADESAA
jgi:prevent-host-death family protein